MDNKQANIDLLFRNGLKDYEALPPPEVWKNIKPIIRRDQKPYAFLRIAAAITVLLSISFLTYKWGEQNISNTQSTVLVPVESLGQLADNITVSSTSPEMKTEDLQREVTVKTEQPLNDQPSGFLSENNGENKIIDTDFLPEINYFFFERRSNKPTGSSNLRDTYHKRDYGNDFVPFPVPDYATDDDKANIKRWSVIALASPTYYPKPQLDNEEISRQISSSEQAHVSYSGGLSFAYKISKKLSIQSGLYYSSVGQVVGDIYSFGGFRQYDYTKGDNNFEVLTSAGLICTDNADIFLLDGAGDRVITRYTNDVFDPAKASLQYLNNSLRQNYSYLEMPVILRYKLIDKIIDINLIGGLSYNFLINNSVYTHFDGIKYDIGKTEGLNSFMLGSSLGMGMEYNLSDKFSLNLEPTFRYYMNPFTESPEFKSHLYSFGIFSGLSYKF